MLAAEAPPAPSGAPSRTRRALAWTLAAFAFLLPLSIAGLNAAAVALTGFVLWRGVSGEDVPWSRALVPFSLALAAYVLVAAAVSALGVDPGVSFKQLFKDVHKVWLAFLLLVALRLGGTRSLSRALGWGCAAAAVYGIGQALFLRMKVAPNEVVVIRAHGFVHPVI